MEVNVRIGVNKDLSDEEFVGYWAKGKRKMKAL